MDKVSDDLRLFSVGDLVDELLSTRKELSALQEATRWIPAGERLPEYTDDYNVACHVLTMQGSFYTVRTYRFERIQGHEPKWCIPNDVEVVTITHWMPLPVPPEGGE